LNILSSAKQNQKQTKQGGIAAALRPQPCPLIDSLAQNLQKGKTFFI
jgi:hypothetical protein